MADIGTGRDYKKKYMTNVNPGLINPYSDY